jgi:type IV pilus assembly protein PilM
VVRVIVFGGGRLTSRLSDAFGVPEAEAEMMKRSIGVIGDSAPAIQCRDETRPLFAEIQSSLRYFVTTVGSAVDRVLLTGGTAALPGLAGMCAATWAVPVEVVAPLRHVGESRGSVARNAASGDDAGSASAVSVGLALGAPVGR